MTQTVQKRIRWIDMARGYGILLVAFGHITSNTVLKSWIYSFHLPLFLFLSGYLYNKNYNLKELLKRKIKGLLIPYLCLGIVVVIFNILRYGYDLKGSLYLFYELILQDRFLALWYISALFFIEIFFYFLYRLFKNEKILAVISLISVTAGFLFYHYVAKSTFWNLDACLMGLPFFTFGFICRNRHDQIDGFLDSRKHSIAIFFIALLTNVLSWYASLKLSGEEVYSLNMFKTIYGIAPLTYLAAFAGIVTVAIFSRWFYIKAIEYIGSNSMLYFAWHQSIMLFLCNDLFEYLNIFSLYDPESVLSSLGMDLLEMLFIMASLTILNMIIMKTKLKFVIGK